MVARAYPDAEDEGQPQTVIATGFIVASVVDDKMIIDDDIMTIGQASAMVDEFGAERKRSAVILPVIVSITTKAIFSEIIQAMKERIEAAQVKIDTHIRESN